MLQKYYMALMSQKSFRAIISAITTLVRFLFTALFCCHLRASAMILLILSSFLTLLCIILNKKKLNQSLLHYAKVNTSRFGSAIKDCPPTLENIVKLVLLLLLQFLLFLMFFCLLFSEIALCNFYYFYYSNNILSIIVQFFCQN